MQPDIKFNSLESLEDLDEGEDKVVPLKDIKMPVINKKSRNEDRRDLGEIADSFSLDSQSDSEDTKEKKLKRKKTKKEKMIVRDDKRYLRSMASELGISEFDDYEPQIKNQGPKILVTQTPDVQTPNLTGDNFYKFKKEQTIEELNKMDISGPVYDPHDPIPNTKDRDRKRVLQMGKDLTGASFDRNQTSQNFLNTQNDTEVQQSRKFEKHSNRRLIEGAKHITGVDFAEEGEYNKYRVQPEQEIPGDIHKIPELKTRQKRKIAQNAMDVLNNNLYTNPENPR